MHNKVLVPAMLISLAIDRTNKIEGMLKLGIVDVVLTEQFGIWTLFYYYSILEPIQLLKLQFINIQYNFK